MGIGAVGNLALALPSLVMPSLPLAGLLVLSALAGFLGQVFTTAGFRTLDAPRGSLLTTSRILFAGILGATLFHEPVTARMIAGALLIVLSLLGVSGVVQLARRASAPSKNRSA
jgi:drug/metabolite transporter (DMT)-like permease